MQLTELQEQIYIVDDDESVLRALNLLFVTSKFRVRAFSSAEEFFSAVPNGSGGCLIMDIHMPGLKGLEAQERLLRSGSQRPVIIITADKDERLKERALMAGVDGFLQKPFDDHELIDLVRSVVNTKKVEAL